MVNNFDKILDECIERLNRGESPEACVADYPEHAKQLEPLLRVVQQTQQAYSFVPSASAKQAARHSFNAAREELRQKQAARQTLFPWPFGWARGWVAVAAVFLLALVGYFGLRPSLLPPELPPQPGPAPSVPSPQPTPEGNFAFLISDDVNAIGDFESVEVSISKVGLLPGGDSGQWIEFEPQLKLVDLTLVQGDKTQEIWRGNIPEGQYNKVFIHVAEVSGILKESGETVEIKLPSQKLHMSKPFQVTADAVTSFTYDLTVIATGNAQSGIKYILKPQIDQSGADHEPIQTKGKVKKATEVNE